MCSKVLRAVLWAQSVATQETAAIATNGNFSTTNATAVEKWVGPTADIRVFHSRRPNRPSGQ